MKQRWAITDYIASLSGANGPGYTNLVTAKHVEEAIDLKNGVKSFESAPVARLAIVGQIMEPGREFHPPTPSVTVQSIYDADSIAFLVRWHDMSAEKSGKNGPALKVPIEEEEAAPGGAQPSESNPFGDVAARQPVVHSRRSGRAGQNAANRADHSVLLLGRCMTQ